MCGAPVFLSLYVRFGIFERLKTVTADTAQPSKRLLEAQSIGGIIHQQH